MKDLVFQYQKGKMPWGWGCTYSNIFGFSILACRSSFIGFFFLFFLYRFNFDQEQLLKWNICRCLFWLLDLPTVRKPVESKWSIVRIRAQYSLVIIMDIICIGNRFTKLWSTKFVQQNFFLTLYSFTKVWICQSYFYFIIRFLSPYQNSSFTKLQAAYTQYKQYSQVTYIHFE